MDGSNRRRAVADDRVARRVREIQREASDISLVPGEVDNVSQRANATLAGGRIAILRLASVFIWKPCIWNGAPAWLSVAMANELSHSKGSSEVV